MEQKNWDRVRELVGYLRYDTAAELEKLNEIRELNRILTNYLLPQQKLIGKQRHGAKVTKQHDAPATPHQRAIRDERMPQRPIIRTNAVFKRIRPTALPRQILALTPELEVLALAKKTPPARPNPDPAKPPTPRTPARKPHRKRRATPGRWRLSTRSWSSSGTPGRPPSRSATAACGGKNI